MIVASLEGAVLDARPYGDTARFQAATASLLAGLSPGASKHPQDSPGPVAAPPA
ncbi:MAG: hypothetical protein ACLPUO_15765 [Streptosporangiaceae bacterium]